MLRLFWGRLFIFFRRFAPPASLRELRQRINYYQDGRSWCQELRRSKHVNAWSLSRTSLKHGTCSDLLSLLKASSGKAEQAFDAPQSGALKAAENAATGILFHHLSRFLFVLIF
ncbi:hypothetical protein [uncultured Agrobacterium sp.]|uniref:hypothetical protein n=1 Tax=uncultured Agrobacterium sp. TaxID=157277 RepID=UPI00258F0316|nr:hypothetical protein [uncultured Agrobacterium sp.]